MKNNSKGSVVMPLLLLVVLSVIAGIGFYVYNVRSSTVNTKESQKQKPVATAKAPSSDFNSENWLHFKSKLGKFEISVPDGWSGKNYDDRGDDFLVIDNFTYQQGQKATITVTTFQNEDTEGVPTHLEIKYLSLSHFGNLHPSEINFSIPYMKGEKQSATFNSDPDGLGIMGDMMYEYKFKIDEKHAINVIYYVKSGDTNQIKLVEAALQSLKVL